MVVLDVKACDLEAESFDVLLQLHALASLGPAEAVRQDASLAHGANVWRGDIVCQGVAESLGLPYAELSGLV